MYEKSGVYPSGSQQPTNPATLTPAQIRAMDNVVVPEDDLKEKDIHDIEKRSGGSQTGSDSVRSKDDINFRSMHWFHCALVMMAETVSLGILSLPSVLGALGLVPGVILILFFSILTTYTGYVLGQFKQRYPHVDSMADAGMVLFGPWGRDIMGAAAFLFLIFIMASHVLTFSIMINVVFDYPFCTILSMVIGTAICIIFTIPKTLRKMAYYSMASSLSVVTAVVITMVGVSQRDFPERHVDYFRTATLVNAFSGVTGICFAFAGHLTFFTFIAEMQKPEDFWKALAALQIGDTALYLTSAIVTYWYVGVDVQSPALKSAGKILGRVAYGVATPTIIISGVINGHVAAKYIYIRWIGEDKLKKRTWSSTAWWLMLITILWVVAWVIAEAIPIFNSLLGLIAAVFISFFSFGACALFWFHLNKGQWFATKKNIFLSCFNAFIILVDVVVMVLGLYSSIMTLKDGAPGKVFSCANNGH